MSQPSVIFVGGVTGSGKSTIGRELSRQLHCEFFDGDDFHTEENKTKMASGEQLNGFFIFSAIFVKKDRCKIFRCWSKAMAWEACGSLAARIDQQEEAGNSLLST